MFNCDRFWHLTWTTYGTWLPGDKRGFVSRVREGAGPRVEHDVPQTQYDADAPGLKRAASAQLKNPPISLHREQAGVLLAQFRETAARRNWKLLAVAVMAQHVHVVVGVPGDPDPESLLRDFKSYGSRALNRQWSKPSSGTWWTESGSKRKKSDDEGLRSAIRYVRDQQRPLVTFLADEARTFIGERGA